MTVNFNRTQITQQELDVRELLHTSTEHKKNTIRTMFRELLHQQKTKNTIRTMTVNCYINRTLHQQNTVRELLHQQNTNTIRTQQENTIRTMTVNCYINRTQITQQELGQLNCYINRTQKNTIRTMTVLIGIATSTEHK